METREVLAGAYKGRHAAMLTHLAFDGRAHCNKGLNLADANAMDEKGRRSRPTCPRCAAKWDRLQAPDVT